MNSYKGFHICKGNALGRTAKRLDFLLILTAAVAAAPQRSTRIATLCRAKRGRANFKRKLPQLACCGP